MAKKNENRVLVSLMCEECKNINYTEEKNEYIKVERTAIYNESLKIRYSILNKERKKYIQAFRVIRTNCEKYIVFADGTEEFYLINDETKNLINDDTYLKEINKMRDLNKKQYFPRELIN